MMKAHRFVASVSAIQSDEHRGRVADMIAAKGPGDHLHGVIMERVNITPVAGCGCESLRVWMNEIGVTACVAHRDAIIDHMVEQGAKHLAGGRKIAINLPGGRIIACHVAREMFDEAMRRCDQPRGTTDRH